MEPIKQIRSRTVVLPSEDIDTDQIIPARFLTTTTKEGLGEHLFAGWRYDKDGAPRGDFVLNRPEAAGAQILVGGRNFGCGSSREHAAWALDDYGFRVVIAPSFGDIFRRNAINTGLAPIVLDPARHVELQRALEERNELTVDLERLTIEHPGGLSIPFEFDEHDRETLLFGLDDIARTLAHAERIDAYEKTMSPRFDALALPA
jgi:3-isopropylmalate/(R)-2-methylmalate dehydratase small subunit